MPQENAPMNEGRGKPGPGARYYRGDVLRCFMGKGHFTRAQWRCSPVLVSERVPGDVQPFARRLTSLDTLKRLHRQRALNSREATVIHDSAQPFDVARSFQLFNARHGVTFPFSAFTLSTSHFQSPAASSAVSAHAPEATRRFT